jgi:hypothetical protein
VDKLLALTGQMPSLQIANIVMLSEQEHAQRAETDARHDESPRYSGRPVLRRRWSLTNNNRIAVKTAHWGNCTATAKYLHRVGTDCYSVLADDPTLAARTANEGHLCQW